MKTKHIFMKLVLALFGLLTVGFLPILSLTNKNNIIFVLVSLTLIFLILSFLTHCVFVYTTSHATIIEKIYITEYKELPIINYFLLVMVIMLLLSMFKNVYLTVTLLIAFFIYAFYSGFFCCLNPILRIWGYKAYKIETKSGTTYYAISKKHKLVQDVAKCFMIEDRLLYLINM